MQPEFVTTVAQVIPFLLLAGVVENRPTLTPIASSSSEPVSAPRHALTDEDLERRLAEIREQRALLTSAASRREAVFLKIAAPSGPLVYTVYPLLGLLAEFVALLVLYNGNAKDVEPIWSVVVFIGTLSAITYVATPLVLKFFRAGAESFRTAWTAGDNSELLALLDEKERLIRELITQKDKLEALQIEAQELHTQAEELLAASPDDTETERS